MECFNENPNYKDERRRPVRGLLHKLGRLLTAMEGEVEVATEAKELDQHAWIQQQWALAPRAKWEFGGPGINPGAIEGVKDLPENVRDELFGVDGVVRERCNDSRPEESVTDDTSSGST